MCLAGDSKPFESLCTFGVEDTEDVLPVSVQLQAIAAVALGIAHQVMQLPERPCSLHRKVM